MGGYIDVRRLRRSSALAGVGDGLVAVALPLVVAATTRDPLGVAAVVAAQHLPWALAVVLGPGLVGGADRRTVLGLAATFRAVAVALVGVRAMTGSASLLGLGVAALAIGVGEALADGAEEDAGPLLARSRSGPGAEVGYLRRSGMIGLAVVGLPLGGVAYQVVAGLPFLVALGVFAVAALGALWLHVPVRPTGERTGLRFEVSAPPALAPGTGRVTLVATVTAGASSAVAGVLVLFALDDLGLGAPGFGLLLAALAAAVAGGGLAAPTIGRVLGLRGGVVVALAVTAVAYVGAGLTGDPARPVLAVLALGVAGAAGMAAEVLLRALLHASGGRKVEGPALDAFHFRVWAVIPVGVLVGGVVAKSLGVAGVVVGAGVVSAFAGFLAATALAGATTGALTRSGPKRG